jgi:hypothetical protein
MKAYRNTEEPTTSQPPPRQTTLTTDHLATAKREREQPELVNLYNDVILIHHRQKRKDIVAIREGRPPDHTGFEKELRNVLDKLAEKLRKNGLSDDQLPRLPDGKPLDLSIKYSNQYWVRALHASRRCFEMQRAELPGGLPHRKASYPDAIPLSPASPITSQTTSTAISPLTPHGSLRSSLAGAPPGTPPNQYNSRHETAHGPSPSLPSPGPVACEAIL